MVEDDVPAIAAEGRVAGVRVPKDTAVRFDVPDLRGLVVYAHHEATIGTEAEPVAGAEPDAGYPPIARPGVHVGSPRGRNREPPGVVAERCPEQSAAGTRHAPRR